MATSEDRCNQAPNTSLVCIDLSSSDGDDSSSDEDLEILPPAASKSRANSTNNNDVAVQPLAIHNKAPVKAAAVPKSCNMHPRHTPRASDDDSDDDDLLLEHTGPTFATIHPPKQTKQQQREQQKLNDREARERQRAQQKQQKQQEKDQQQELKKRRIEQVQQKMGRFADKEIVVLMHTSLYQELEGATVTSALEETYKVYACTTVPASNAIQWIRQDYLLGGAEQAVKEYREQQSAVGSRKRPPEEAIPKFQQMDRLALVFYNPSSFVKLLHRGENDDDYPKLAEYVESFLRMDRRLILILCQVGEEINRQWISHRASRRPVAPPTDAELNDCIVWLMVCYGVECIVCDTSDLLLANLQKLTRAQSEVKYQKPVTELECVKKVKADVNATSLYDKARDTWIRQLQQIPGMGEPKARHLATYVPTMRCLWELYQDPNKTEQEKRILVAPLLQEGRNFPKLSDTVYRLLTSRNRDELL